MKRNEGISLVAGRLAFARGLARVPLAILPLVIVRQYGASAATDCFFLVYAGVLFATNAFAPLLETAVVPFVAEARHAGREAAFVRAVLWRAALMGAPVSLGLALLALGWRATGWPARPGWDDGWLFLLWLSTVPVLNALASVLAGYLNAEEWYLTVAGSATLRGVVALAIGFGSAQFGLASYASGLAAGELAALGALAASEAGRRVFAVPPSADNLGPFWSLFLSMAFGGLANSSKGFVDRFVATTLGVGAVSILEFVERIFLMAVSFLGAPFATVVLSRWSAAHPSGGRSSATALLSGVNYSQRLAALLGAAIFAGGSLLAVSPIATWLFQRFSAAEAHTARIALICYLAGAVPYLAGLVTTQAIFVVRDAAFVARIAIAVALLNVPLDLIGMWAFGLPGIALATSALHVIGWVAASRRLKRHASPALEPGAAR